MFWVIFLGVFIFPVLIFGIVVDLKRKKRTNTNYGQYKTSNSNAGERNHYSMGENIRGD
ncbi:hypothetical protein [Virgibacillus sp. L01]|uniref:hypothetical protein n=1 Tax=Virgibacillus sp. L01 TaxID=3457429 RepID=UPI003FD235F3